MKGTGYVKTGGISVASLTHHLKGIDFPCTRQEMIDHAARNDADDNIISLFMKMYDRTYDSMADVMSVYGQIKKKAA